MKPGNSGVFISQISGYKIDFVDTACLLIRCDLCVFVLCSTKEQIIKFMHVYNIFMMILL